MFSPLLFSHVKNDVHTLRTRLQLEGHVREVKELHGGLYNVSVYFGCSRSIAFCLVILMVMIKQTFVKNVHGR